MVKDPVCRTIVVDGSSHQSTKDGTIYQFCSKGCKAAFDDAPDSWTVPAGHAAHSSPAGVNGEESLQQRRPWDHSFSDHPERT